MQRPIAYFRSIKEWLLYHLVIWDRFDAYYPARSKWMLLKLQD